LIDCIEWRKAPDRATIRGADIPVPLVGHGHVLVEYQASIISCGFEKMTVEMARKFLPGKAGERPDWVKCPPTLPGVI